jgi:hypothetical protein
LVEADGADLDRDRSDGSLPKADRERLERRSAVRAKNFMGNSSENVQRSG